MGSLSGRQKRVFEKNVHFLFSPFLCWKKKKRNMKKWKRKFSEKPRKIVFWVVVNKKGISCKNGISKKNWQTLFVSCVSFLFCVGFVSVVFALFLFCCWIVFGAGSCLVFVFLFSFVFCFFFFLEGLRVR